MNIGKEKEDRRERCVTVVVEFLYRRVGRVLLNGM